MHVRLKLGVAVIVATVSSGCSTSSAPPARAPEPRVAAVEVHTETPAQITTALSDDHCRHDTLCALSGFCTAQGDECIASIDSDCEASQQCLSDGACTARDAVCVAASDAECRRSEACLREGRCRASDGYCSS